MTPGKKLSSALVRAIDQMFGVSVVVEDVVHQMQTAGDLFSGLPENHLLLLIAGPISSRSLVASDPQGLVAFIEMLTIGRVSDRPAVPRMPTETNTALVAPMVDFLLAEVSRFLQPAMENLWIHNFQYQVRIEDYLDLAAALPAEYFQVFLLRLDLATIGDLAFAFPDCEVVAELMPAVNMRETKKIATVWLDVAGELNVLVAKSIMPLEKAAKLVAGDLVRLPQAVMAQVTNCAEHTDFQFAGHLGQAQGMRAVRLV